MKKTLSILTLSIASCFSAQAEVHINGFANLVSGITSSDDSFYSYDDSLSFTSESLFALQVSSDINDRVTATGQIVARGENGYDADFEWAYFTFSANDNLSISAGRLRQPLFKYSTSSDIGYSYHWVNTPQVVYGVPFTNMDGVRFDYSNYAGDWEYNLQLGVGKFTGAIAEGNNLFIVSAELVRDWFKIRGVYSKTSLTLSIPPITAVFDGVREMGLTKLADDLAVNDDAAIFTGIGVEVDKYNWFVSAELTTVDIEDSYLQKDQSFYVTAGLRINQWTPSITYEKKDANNDPKFTDQLVGLPAAISGAVTGITLGFQADESAEYDVVTLGVRYDISTNVALKADFSTLSDDLDEESDATLMRFALNYVF